MKNFTISLLFVSVILLSNCVPRQISTLTGVDYEEGKNQTNYFVFPYGSVSIPGKWNKTKYNTISLQQFFVNEDSVQIAIAFGAYNGYEFNTNGSKKGFEFVKAFYEWDSKYFVETHGLNRSLIEADSINNFVIWRLFGTIDKGTFDSYFLFGEKNGSVNNFSVMINDKWDEKYKIEFLKNLFIVKREE